MRRLFTAWHQSESKAQHDERACPQISVLGCLAFPRKSKSSQTVPKGQGSAACRNTTGETRKSITVVAPIAAARVGAAGGRAEDIVALSRVRGGDVVAKAGAVGGVSLFNQRSHVFPDHRQVVHWIPSRCGQRLTRDQS